MLIDPVGILRRHQREVRHPMTTMTNVSKQKKGTAMRTLDKIWDKLSQADNDVSMVDTETKTMNETTNHNMRNHEKKEKHANDDNNGEIEDNDDEEMEETSTEKGTAQRQETNDGQETPKEPMLQVRFPITIRFKIKALTSKEAHQKHTSVLQAINSNMDYSDLYSKDNDKLEWDKIMESNFDYHETGNRNKFFIVVHRMVLNQKYYGLKSNENIFKALKANNCYIQNHMWSIKEWDIVNAGFISGASPKHQAKDTIQANLEKIKNPPKKYHLHATTVKSNIDGIDYSTYAYEIECNRKDLNEVTTYVAETCKEFDQTFLNYMWKYSHPMVFVNGIKKQNSLVNNIRTIPIYGIIPDAMNYLYPIIAQRANILDISSTSRTPSLGRWNVYTTSSKFEEETKWLQKNLQKLYEDKSKHDQGDVPTDFVPEVRFNTTITFASKQTDPLIDAAEKSLRSFSHTIPGVKSWASVVGGSNATSSFTAPSNYTTTIQNLNNAISNLSSRLDKIEEMMATQQKLVERAQQFEQESMNTMERLTAILLQLEQRTNHVEPRRLDRSFEQMEPRKRQDTRGTPTKNRATS